MSSFNLSNGCGSCEEVFTNVPNMSAMQQPMDQTSQYLVNSVSNSNSSQAHAANLVNNAMRQAGIINTTNGNTMLNATSNGANQNIQPQQPSKPPVRKAEQVVMVENFTDKKSSSNERANNFIVMGIVIVAALACNETVKYYINQSIKFNDGSPLYYVAYSVIAILLGAAVHHYVNQRK